MPTSVSTTTFTSKSFSMMSDSPDLASFINAGKNCHCCMSTAAERKSSRVWISNLDWWAGIGDVPLYEEEDKQASSTRHHPAPDGGPPRLNGDLLPHLPDGLRQRTKSSSHLFIIVTSDDSIIIVDRFPPWSWLECLVCCVAIVWSGGAKISDEKCNLGRPGHTLRFGKVCLWYDIRVECFALVRTYDIVCSKFGQSQSYLMKKVHSALWENLVIWRGLAWAAGCQSLVNLQRDLHKK